MPNVDRICQLVGHLTLFPDSHDQGIWLRHAYDGSDVQALTAEEIGPTCGTTGCVAGWASVFFGPVGAVYYVEDGNASIYVPDVEGQFILRNGHSKFYNPDRDRSRVRYNILSVAEVAREALEISSDQSGWLFEGHRTPSELIRGFQKIITRPTVSYLWLESNCRDSRL